MFDYMNLNIEFWLDILAGISKQGFKHKQKCFDMGVLLKMRSISSSYHIWGKANLNLNMNLNRNFNFINELCFLLWWHMFDNMNLNMKSNILVLNSYRKIALVHPQSIASVQTAAIHEIQVTWSYHEKEDCFSFS